MDLRTIEAMPAVGNRSPDTDDLSIWRSSLEPLAIPGFPGRLVVVAPHPDDETLGAGALMHDLGLLGWDVRVVVVSDGAASHVGARDLAAVRSCEVAEACERLGLARPPVLLSYPDGQLEMHCDALVKDLRACEARKPHAKG